MNEQLQLTKTEEKTLRTIVMKFAEEPFTCDALEAAAPFVLTGYEAEIGVAGLRSRSIVVTRRKAWGERVHALSPGVFAYWQRLFVIDKAFGDLIVSDENVTAAREPVRGFASMLLGLVSAAHFSNIGFTQKGALHKREVVRLAERVDVSDEELKGLQCSYVHQDKYGASFAVIFDAALRLGLLEKEGDRLRTSQRKLNEWLSLSREEMEKQLLSLWWDVYMPSDVWLQHAAALLQSLPAGSWTTLERTRELLMEAGVPLGKRTIAEAEQAVLDHWLAPMRAFGWLEFGELRDREGGIAFRWRERETAEDQLYILPDFEVIVPPGVPQKLRWELENACVYEGGDEAQRYRITKESWLRAIDSGRSFEQMIETLRDNSKYGLPANVEETLREWGSRYGTVTIDEVTLLRCKDAAHAEQIRTHPMTAPYIVSEVGEGNLIVKPNAAKELFDVLEKQGYSPRRTAVQEKYVSGDETSTAGNLMEGIVIVNRSAALFPVDPNPPLPQSFQLAKQLPLTWVKQLRRYHPSTMRDLLETAVRLKTSVLLRLEGESRTFYPRRLLLGRGDEFSAVGLMDGSEVSIDAGQWEEAQLLLPE